MNTVKVISRGDNFKFDRKSAALFLSLSKSTTLNSTYHTIISCIFSSANSVFLQYFFTRTSSILNHQALLMTPVFLYPVLAEKLAYISSLSLDSSLCSVSVQMEKWNLIGYHKWPFSLQQTICQALHMKKGLKMQLADVHVMSAMWVSGEWDP